MPPRRSTSTRRRSTASASSTGSSLRPAGNEVAVRMYGQGLGDCFLLAFPRSGGAGGGANARPVYMVIDCGVIGGTPDGPARMKQVVQDIKQTTLDPSLKDAAGQPMGHIDVLAITHEHWDHLSGFVQAEAEWKAIQVDAIWTAWTEKPGDGLPDVLKRIIEKQHKTMAAIADRAVRFGLSDQHETVLGLMSFLSDAMTLGEPFSATAGTGEAFQIAKDRARATVFCEPGDVRQVPGTDAIAYVLGPPRDNARLRQMDPSKKDPETYTEQAAGPNALAQALVRALGDPGAVEPATDRSPGFAPPDPTFSLQSMAEGRSAFNAVALPLLGPSVAPPDASNDEVTVAAAEQDAYDRSFPFDRALRVPLPVVEREALSLKAGSGAPLYPALASYFEELNGWRRIDFDWLAGAEAFALQADSLTNNTCLVLAFELPPRPSDDGDAERKVLLFVGDAQVGNWLSWYEIPRWTPQGGAAPSQPKPDIVDLLRRTTFYKVGHHGSHNATLKARGVERMPDDRPLTAFVPVSPVVAREIKDWCQMPLDQLLDALAARTGNRVVLANGNVWPPIDDPAALAQARQRIGVEVSSAMLPPKLRPKDRKEIEGAVPLWVQIAIPY